MVGIAARKKEEECEGMGGDARPRHVNGE